ncbi:MAG: radical SAM protein [Deltaproteobacteria bacterium]|nr:radical SAM protein [Deltaproteobacteria bacterium]
MSITDSVTKWLEKGAASAAEAAWPVFQRFNGMVEGKPFQPSWAPAPLAKSHERSYPQLGWPRQTDSLCPACVKEVREAVLSGKKDLDYLRNANPGEIKATILERDDQILMVKECPKHGYFEDVMSVDPAFTRRIEGLFPGRDFKSPATPLRNHGSSSVKYGRGAVLTVDLTNRCNMMCEPCFMDANQVGFVHELSWEDIKEVLDNSMQIKPRRQMSVQFSGGEPTLSPHFLQACSYARELGYVSIQAATNGLRFALEPDFAKKAKEAGLRLAYLQFDGATNKANAHRKIGNLFDVRRRIIQNLKEADIDVVLVTTIVNTVNDHQVGPILDFAIENIDAVTTIAYQPVSFTGRDEDISDEDRKQQRYTLSHLARDLSKYTGYLDPMRDFLPLSALGPFSDMTDVLLGEEQKFGSINCGCHPNCGIGTILLVNKETKDVVPLTKVLNVERLLADLRVITDANRGKALSLAQLTMAMLRNYDADAAPKGFDITTLVKQYLSQTGAVGLGKDDAKNFKWRVLFIGGMWFQDLFNYDFRRTEMCIIPYGTQLGEISFCAYNTGIGWRQIVERMHANASTVDWYREKGRHKIFAGNRDVEVPAYDAALTVTAPASAALADEFAARRDAEAELQREARKREARRAKYEARKQTEDEAPLSEAAQVAAEAPAAKPAPSFEDLMRAGADHLAATDPSRRGGASAFNGAGCGGTPRPTLKAPRR